MSLIELDAEGQVSAGLLPFRPIRGARVLRGRHAELLLSEPSDDFIKAVLTDDAPVIDGMKRLRAIFPNACELVYARDERPAGIRSANVQLVSAAEPVDVVRSFLTEVGLDDISDPEQGVIAASLMRLRRKEDAE